jgi:hypothetical protein
MPKLRFALFIAIGLAGCAAGPDLTPTPEAQGRNESHFDLPDSTDPNPTTYPPDDLPTGLEIDDLTDAATCNHASSTTTDMEFTFWAQKRYAQKSDHFIKLYMSTEARAAGTPWAGFTDHNHPAVHDSCGPVAGFNVFRWYGATARSYNCENPEDLGSVGGITPTPTCEQDITIMSLVDKMNTNNWSIPWSTYDLINIVLPNVQLTAGSLIAHIWEQDGSTTPDVVSAMRHYGNFYMHGAEFVDRHDGSPSALYQELWDTLHRGNPVIVPYKTKDWGGHFATIIGMEKCGNSDIDNDIVYIANIRKEDAGPHAMTWKSFRQRWRRDYAGPDSVLEHYGEHKYTRLYFNL